MQAQGDTLEPWQQSKVTKAADYLDAVFNAVDDEHDMGEEQGVEEEAKHGLYYNVNKRKKAGTSRPASSPKAPTAQAWKDAAKTAKKEGVSEESNGGGSQNTQNQVYQYMIRQAPDFMKTAITADVKKAIMKAMSYGPEISVPDLASYAYGILKTNDLDESWDDIKKFGKKAAVAGAIGLGIGAAHAGGWSPSDVAPGAHNQLPDIVAHVKFKVGDKEISKEINLGSHYRSPGEASKELENFLQSKGIKFYQYSLERVKPKADDKIDSSPATSDMKGGMDTSEPAATGPSTDNYMAKDNDPERGPSMGGKFVKEGAKVDRQAKHITASMMKKGKSKKDAESIAWAHIKHPKNESIDPYFESLQSMVERQLEPNMELDTWIDNFQHADPNKYHQFKNKTPEKKK
jgi:hypothetical protein